MIQSGPAPWMERASLVERAAKAVVLALIVVVVVYPFLQILSTSLADAKDIAEGGGLVLWPRNPTLNAYRSIFEGGIITRAILVSLGVTTVGTLLSLAATIAMAYGLSRPIVGGRVILLIALFTLLFSPGIIPNYLLVKQVGLLNTYGSLILPVLISAFNLVVLRQFFMSIPQELLDSAKIDGAGDLGILFRIVLPLSKAVLAVIALFYAVAYWNAFFNALMYLNDSSLWPLQLVLRLYVLQGAHLPGSMSGAGELETVPEQAIQMAVVIIAIIPILILYPFLQKYFVRGVLTGAIKG